MTAADHQPLNPDMEASLRRGLAQSAAGQTTDLGDFTQHMTDDDGDEGSQGVPPMAELMIDPGLSTAAAQATLERLAQFDGGYPEDVPEPVRNAWRGRRALQAVQLYADRDGNAEGEPVEQYVRDLLSDLMHLCDLFEASPDAEEYADFVSLVGRANYIYADEVVRP